MKELSVFIPYVMLMVSMVAAFTVVSVATLKILRSSYSRTTALVLALGVTIMALVGTAPIIFVPLQGKELAKPLFPTGSALMLLPFLTLAVGRLLCELLVAASGTVAEREPQSGATEKDVAWKKAVPAAKESRNAASKANPKGRPQKQRAKEEQVENQAGNVKGKQKLDQPASATKPN